MQPAQSAEAFRRHLADQVGAQQAQLAEFVRAVFGFYEGQRAVGLATGEYADALLYQFGCYDWGSGEEFQLDITRQFIEASKDDDDAISQLNATAFYCIDPELRALGRANRWCRSPADIAEFKSFVLQDPAFLVAATRTPVRFGIDWGYV